MRLKSVQERCLAAMARYGENRDTVGEWFGRASLWSCGIGLAAVMGLVAIEATVERYGIVQVFIDRNRNAALLSGHAAGAGPSAVAVCALALIASIPFILVHASEGWISARDACLASAIEAYRERCVWQTASELDKTRRERVIHPIAPLTSGNDAANGLAVEIAVSPEDKDQMHCVDDSENTPTLEEQSEKPPESDVCDDVPEPNSVRVELAVHGERAREAYARLREALARKREDVKWYEEQITDLQKRRQPEQPEASLEGKRRIEDAYDDLTAAVRQFDGVYDREQRLVEQLLQGGVIVRARAWFVRKADC